MSIESIRLGIRAICDWILKHLSVLMSLVLIAYGVAGIVYLRDDLLRALVIYTMPIVSGVLILLDKHRSVFWAVGLYAIGIGFSRFMNYLPGVFDDSMITFAISLTFCIMGGNLIYSGSRYLRGNARSIIFVLIGSTAFVILTGISIAMGFNDAENLESFFAENIDDLISLAIYLMYIGLVWSEPVRKSTNVAIALRLSSGIRGVDGTMMRASIPPTAVQEILDFVDGKTSSDKGPIEGPVYSEYCFPYQDKFRTNYASLQRWNGPEGEIYMTLSDHNKGSFIGTSTVRVEGAKFIDNALVIQCADRGEAIFHIKDADELDGPLLFDNTKKAGGDAA